MKTLRMLYRGEHHFDFPLMWRKALWGSGALVLLSVGVLLVAGLNLGIEFEGGTSWEVNAPGQSVAEARDALSGTGAAAGKIQTVGSSAIRVRADLDDPASVSEVTVALRDFAGVQAGDVSVTTVGSSRPLTPRSRSGTARMIDISRSAASPVKRSRRPAPAGRSMLSQSKSRASQSILYSIPPNSSVDK